MKPGMIACIAATLALAACGTVGSTLSGRQIDSLSSGEVRTRAMDQLGDNLVPYTPIDRYSRGQSSGPKPLYDITFATRPYGYYEGWCRFDALELHMSPVAAEERTADTRVNAVGVDVQSAFLELKPELSSRIPTPEEQAVLHVECGRLALWDDRFVHAPNFLLARAGQKAYRELKAGILSGAMPFENDCAEPGGDSWCKEWAERDRTLEFWVDSCGHDDPFPTCLSIGTYDTNIEVRLAKGVIRKVVIGERVFLTSGS
jgi:hypothetical protein